LTGQIISIKADRTESTVKHDDVKGFMPAMTMAFTIKEPKLLDGLRPGDLISATLVITDEEGYLKGIRKTGSAPLAPRSPTPVADLLMPGEPLPDIVFVDEDGKPRPLSSYRGQAVVITFIYTRCPLPDYCPRMNRQFASLQQAIKARPGLRERARLISVSFDPDFDTPSQLGSTARSLGADPGVWRFVTAPRGGVDAFGATLGLSVLREGPKGENITHNLRTALVDRDGLLVKTYNGSAWSPDEVVRDLEALVK
jgi:protein SCO1/2